jgi:phosphoglycolate phosphatase-like HAD superfamily hydrolase
LRFAGYILDVEGTLVDCVPQQLLSWQEALRIVGLRVPYSSLQLYAGLDGGQILDLVAAGISAGERTRVLEIRCQIYEAIYLPDIKAVPGAHEAVQALAMRGKLALATDCKGPELRHYRMLLDIDPYLFAIACGDDVEYGRPDPRFVGTALRKLGLPAGKTLMIADTPYDAEAAHDAGVMAAGVLSGGFAAKVLAEAGCVAIADRIFELVTRLDDAVLPSAA